MSCLSVRTQPLTATGAPSQTSTIPYHTMYISTTLLDGTVRLSRLRPVSGVNYIAPTRLAVGKASLDPLRSVQFSSVPYASGTLSGNDGSVPPHIMTLICNVIIGARR